MITVDHPLVMPEPNSGCWIWIGNRFGSGYGAVDNRTGAHRYSWECNNNEKIPKGFHVLHKCDNPPCVNPDHLFIGTHNENMNDKVQKGRHAKGLEHGEKVYAACTQKGEHSYCAKLTEEQVLFAKVSAQSTNSLAKQFGVSRETLRRARIGKRWRHLS